MTICRGTIETLRCLTEDFIDFTRFENQKGLPINKEAVNLRTMIDEIKSIFIFQAEEKGIDFYVNIGKSFQLTFRPGST
jgi:signal transduction histidine kinase